MTLNEKLSKIQAQLKVEKGEYNSFSNYKYRTIDNILSTVKPMLLAEKLTVKLNDDIVQIGDRYYVKATASITDGTDEISTTAYAREPQTKPKFDESQVTGSASTYARKYALCGLLAIEGEQDPDSQEPPQQPQAQKSTKQKEKTVSNSQLKTMFDILDTPEKVQAFKDLVNSKGYENSEDILAKDWTVINKEMNQKLIELEQKDARDKAPF